MLLLVTLDTRCQFALVMLYTTLKHIMYSDSWIVDNTSLPVSSHLAPSILPGLLHWSCFTCLVESILCLYMTLLSPYVPHILEMKLGPLLFTIQSSGIICPQGWCAGEYPFFPSHSMIIFDFFATPVIFFFFMSISKLYYHTKCFVFLVTSTRAMMLWSF